MFHIRTHKLSFSRVIMPALIVLMASILTACITQPDRGTAQAGWAVQGKVGLWAYDKQESANIDWQDCLTNYRIRLSGPLGVGTAIIYGDEAGVSLHQNNSDVVQADSPEALLESLGWSMPVSALRYWLKALPVPGVTHEKALQDGLITDLTQLNWHINYQYAGKLPSRIDMNNGEVRLKWILRDWAQQAVCEAP